MYPCNKPIVFISVNCAYYYHLVEKESNAMLKSIVIISIKKAMSRKKDRRLLFYCVCFIRFGIQTLVYRNQVKSMINIQTAMVRFILNLKNVTSIHLDDSWQFGLWFTPTMERFQRVMTNKSYYIFLNQACSFSCMIEKSQPKLRLYQYMMFLFRSFIGWRIFVMTF